LFVCFCLFCFDSDLLHISNDITEELAWQSCEDAVEHRNGEQRIPLITGIGESICVSDITQDELRRALELIEGFNTDAVYSSKELILKRHIC
jgi:hypothetical protein